MAGEDPGQSDPWNYGCGLGQNPSLGTDNVKDALWAQIWQCPTERQLDTEWWTSTNKYANSAFVPYPRKDILTNQNAIYLIITPPDVQES